MAKCLMFIGQYNIYMNTIAPVVYYYSDSRQTAQNKYELLNVAFELVAF